MPKIKTKILTTGILMPLLALPLFLHASSDTEVHPYDGMVEDRWSITADTHSFNETACEQKLLIAIEGGGTNTRIRINSAPTEISDTPETLYSTTTKEGSNLNHSLINASHVVKTLIDNGIDAIASENLWNSERICYDLGLGMAGTEGKNTVAFLKGLLNDSRMRRAVLTSDGEIAWLSAFDTEGIMVISGTGSVILARNAAGEIFRKSGFGAPLSDQPSAYSLCSDYGRCIAKEVKLKNRKAVWRNDIKLAYFEKLLAANDGSDKALLVKFNALAQTNPAKFAAMAPDVIKHYAPQMFHRTSWNGSQTCFQTSFQEDLCGTETIDDSLNDKDYCATLAIHDALQDLFDAIHLDQVLHGLPFAIHGTFGKAMWEKMPEIFGEMEAIEQRKVSTPVDPLAGAFKLLTP